LFLTCSSVIPMCIERFIIQVAVSVHPRFRWCLVSDISGCFGRPRVRLRGRRRDQRDQRNQWDQRDERSKRGRVDRACAPSSRFRYWFAAWTAQVSPVGLQGLQEEDGYRRSKESRHLARETTLEKGQLPLNLKTHVSHIS